MSVQYIFSIAGVFAVAHIILYTHWIYLNLPWSDNIKYSFPLIYHIPLILGTSWHILAHLGTSWPQNNTLICSWTNWFVWYGTNIAVMRNLMFNQWTWLFVRYFSDKPAQTTVSNLWNNTLQLHFFSDLAAKHSQWGRQRLVDSHPRNSWNKWFYILPYFEA